MLIKCGFKKITYFKEKFMDYFNIDIKTYSKNYFSNLNRILNTIDKNEIMEVCNQFTIARENKKCIYFIGNGGSATTASHMANDLAIGTRLTSNPFRTMSLCDNNSIITAVGNDFGYDQIFTRQLSYLYNEGDLIVAISASGNSPNLVDTCKWSKNKLTSIALTSFEDGGEIAKICDFKIHIPTKLNEYGPAEDAHLILNHLFVSFFSENYKKT